jgi:hypothetical protein
VARLQDDEAWKKAEPVLRMKNADGREVAAKYPTEVRAVFTLDGICLAFKLTEPSPGKLKRDVKTPDQPSCVVVAGADGRNQAATLTNYLAKITGAEIPIETSAATGAKDRPPSPHHTTSMP